MNMMNFMKEDNFDFFCVSYYISNEFNQTNNIMKCEP